ncbi:MAG: GNAT family N-acetyltransferase [Candidatus Wenzhouxiangella sp. M2_3B_020]
MSQEDIRHRPEERRFEIKVEGHVGVLDYTRDGDVVSMDSVRVPDAIGGRGVAGDLTRHALDHARAGGWKVVPRCPYVRKWIERHPDYADLVTG